jgi:hypothetical protein
MESEEREGPFIKFFPGDFMKDPCVQVLSFEARAVWIFMLFLMHDSSRRGYLVTASGRQMTSKQLANALQISEARVNAAWAEMDEAGTYSKTDDSIIYCRRMARATDLSEKRADAGSKGGSQAKPKQTPSKAEANPKQPSDARVRSQKSEVRSQSRTAAAANVTIVEAPVVEPEAVAAAAPQEPERFPKAERLIRQTFPGTDGEMVQRIVREALARKPDVTDAELCHALRSTYRENQRGAGLWPKTVAAYFATANGARAPGARGDVCPDCGASGEILNPEFDGQPTSAWLDLPRERQFVPCPRCRGKPERKRPETVMKNPKEKSHAATSA